jgi:ATP-dependent DNA ligase
MLYAFDLLELNGKDLRPLPLGDRKAKLDAGFKIQSVTAVRQFC